MLTERAATMNRRSVVKTIATLAGVIASISFVKFGSSNWRTRSIYSVELVGSLALIADIAETIIPRTDTPGATDAGVATCLVKLIGECEPPEVQQSFVRWLKAIERDSLRKFGKPFSRCEHADRAAILMRYEHNGDENSLFQKVRLRLFGPSGLKLMKKYTVISYCTSMEGATQALAYDYIPGAYQACIPVKAGQKSWATE